MTRTFGRAGRIAQGLGFGLAVAWSTQSCKTPAEHFECSTDDECNLVSSGECRQGACFYPGGSGGTGNGGTGNGGTGNGGTGNGGTSGSGGSTNGGSSGSGSGGTGAGGKSSGGTGGGSGGSGGTGGNPDGGPGGEVLTVVASKIGGKGTIDGVGPLARLDTPGCVAFDGGHFLYMGDMYAETIRRLDTNTKEVTTIAGYPFSGFFQDGKGQEGRFVQPECVAYDGTDPQNPALYVSEWRGARIRKIALNAENAVTLIAGSTQGEIGFADGVGEAARFEGPEAMARRGNFLYVVEFYNHALRAINLTTRAVTTVIGDPVNKASGSADGPIATARLTHPHALALDSTGNRLFIGEHTGGERVRVLDFTNNTVSTLVPAVGDVQSLAYDATTNHLIATIFDEQKILDINVATKTFTLLAGSSEFDEVDGSPTTAAFRSPHGVAVGPNRTLFISDFDGPTIRKLVANGSGAYQTTTIAGLAANRGHGDATGEDARFDAAGDMALAPDNHTLYVLDGDDNCAVRTFDTGSKQVGTLAGGAGCTRVDGTGVAASFALPGAMALGLTTGPAAPPLFVAEQRGVVRKVDTGTHKVTTLNTGDDALPTWRGIAVTGTTIYVSGEFERKIYQLPIGGGTLAAYAGTGSEGCDDSAAAISTLGRPTGILWDGATTLFFADSECGAIRRIDLSNNTIQTVAGGNAEGDENPDGVGRGAKFSYPASLSWDRQRKGFYVQDVHVVRWVNATTFEVKTVVGDKDSQGGVWLPPNPPRLNFPGGLIEGLDGELYISSENAILRWGMP